MSNNVKKIGTISIILMIFTNVFGFLNSARAFYLMGYSAIFWYILSAILFFIPFAMQIIEISSAFKDKEGGINTWMSKSVSENFGFIATFMWYAGYFIWMVNVASGIWIHVSNAIFASDYLLIILGQFGILLFASLFVIIINEINKKGIKTSSLFGSIGGSLVIISNIILILGSILILYKNEFNFATPFLRMPNFFQSININNQSIIFTLGFLVYAIFAYGGIESVGGLIDKFEDKKKFPKIVFIALITIVLGYSIAILAIGSFTDWDQYLSKENASLSSAIYIIMQRFGYELASALGFSSNIANNFANFFTRYVGMANALIWFSAFVNLSFSPLKQLINGQEKSFWPKAITKTNKQGINYKALNFQGLGIILIIFFVTLGGDNARGILDVVITMANVSTIIPIMFISYSYIQFKKKDNIKKVIIIIKNKNLGVFLGYLSIISIFIALILTIIDPIVSKNDYLSSIYMFIGPLIFSLIAWFLLKRKSK